MQAENSHVEYHERTWQDFWNDGCRYLDVARRAFPARPRFTPEILYHLIGMGLENLFMAWLGQNRNLPENHTVRDLVRAAEKLEVLAPELRRDLIRFDRFMGLCSLEPVPILPPQVADVPLMLDIAERTKDFLAARYLTENGTGHGPERLRGIDGRSPVSQQGQLPAG